MKTDEHTDGMERLVERFFEGETTLADEKRLYAFFASEDVPPSLEHLRALFRYIERDMPAELSRANVKIPLPPRSRRRTWLSIAASAAIIAGIAFLYFHNREEVNPFEGSYVTRDGVRITDPKVIRLEIEVTARMIAEQREEINRIKNQKREIYEEFMDRFHDEDSL